MYNRYDIYLKKIIPLYSEYLHNAYIQAKKNFYIIHYTGPYKSWENKNVDLEKGGESMQQIHHILNI